MAAREKPRLRFVPPSGMACPGAWFGANNLARGPVSGAEHTPAHSPRRSGSRPKTGSPCLSDSPHPLIPSPGGVNMHLHRRFPYTEHQNGQSRMAAVSNNNMRLSRAEKTSAALASSRKSSGAPVQSQLREDLFSMNHKNRLPRRFEARAGFCGI
jgi:hypothetical protein